MTTNPPKQPQTEQAQTPRPEKSFKWLIILLAIVAGCLLAFYFLNFHGGIGDKGDFGAFGDYFGGVLNPILGFATVGLLVWSLKYQMDELALSRQELALTRQELAETKEETALSRKAMEEQVNHIKNEARLNELTRLLDLSNKKYEAIINVKFPITSYPESPYSNKQFNETYGSLINYAFINLHPNHKTHIINQAINNLSLKQHLDKLRREAILIADLALKYYSINESTEFARAYLFDSFDMLKAVERIYPNEITQDRLSTIASYMGEYMDVAKVPSATES